MAIPVFIHDPPWSRVFVSSAKKKILIWDISIRILIKYVLDFNNLSKTFYFQFWADKYVRKQKFG